MNVIIEKTMNIGNEYSEWNIEDVRNNLEKMNIDFNSKMQHFLYNHFRDNPRNYSAEELSLLIKGVIIGEVYLMSGGEQGFGSVTATSTIGPALGLINENLAKEIDKWADSFGFKNYMYNTRCSDEYILKYSKDENKIKVAQKSIVLREEKEKEKLIYDTQMQTTAKNRKRNIIILKENEAQDRALGLREILIEELASMSNEERLIKLAEDDRHSPKYYPLNMFYNITREEIQNLKPEHRSKLSKKFDIPLKKSPWKKFKAWHSL